MKESLRILLGEDEYLCLIGLRDNLIKLGHEIVGAASDGQDLVKIALEASPDLIITDINMPLMDGIQAIKEINLKLCVPTIIVSGYHHGELIENAIKQGVYNYLIKPVDIWDLKAAVDITMSKFEEIQSIKVKLDSTQKSLDDRKYIEKAKGIIMKTFNLNESDAMKRMQKMSTNSNSKMVNLAKGIIDANKLLNL